MGRERTVPVVAVSLVVEVHLKRGKILGRVLERGQETSTLTHKPPTTPTPARCWRTARGSHIPFPGMSRAQKREGRSRGRNRRCRRQGARGGSAAVAAGGWVGVMHLRVDRRRLAPRYERDFMVPERCATVACVRRSTCACELRSRVSIGKKVSGFGGELERQGAPAHPSSGSGFSAHHASSNRSKGELELPHFHSARLSAHLALGRC